MSWEGCFVGKGSILVLKSEAESAGPSSVPKWWSYRRWLVMGDGGREKESYYFTTRRKPTIRVQ